MSKDKLNINYWLRKIYVSKIFQYLPFSKIFQRKIIFTSIFKSKHWVQKSNLPKEKISVSGHGSNIDTEQSKNLISSLSTFFKNYNIKSILDMPCGDFLWMNELIKKNKKINYLGIDIVDELIKENIKIYENDKIKFKSFDIVNFKTMENFDLVLMRDFFIHTNNSDIRQILFNLKEMNIKYFAFENYEILKNKDVTTGKHRKVNLKIHPFRLGEPIYSFQDYEIDKFIYFYEKKSLINIK